MIKAHHGENQGFTPKDKKKYVTKIMLLLLLSKYFRKKVTIKRQTASKLWLKHCLGKLASSPHCHHAKGEAQGKVGDEGERQVGGKDAVAFLHESGEGGEAATETCREQQACLRREPAVRGG